MLIDFALGQGSIILRVKLRDSSVSTGAGLQGLTFSSSGLRIAVIADVEATTTAYTVAGATIETITTLGTYAAPTATKCRFKEVDATNHKGVYELHIADARFAVASAKSALVSIAGATNLAECDAVIPLRSVNPYDAVRGGMTALPNAAANANGGLPILSVSGTTLGYTLATLTTYSGNTPQSADIGTLIIRPPQGVIVSATSTSFVVTGISGVTGQYTGRRLYLTLAAGGDLYTDACTAHSVSGSDHTFTFAVAQNATPAAGDTAMVLGL